MKTKTPDDQTELERSNLARRIAAAAGRIRALREAGRRGQLADLRRMHPAVIPPEPFWSFIEAYDIPARDEDFWLAVLPMMVRHDHQMDATPGRVLAEARMAPSRVQRWLRMDRERAWREAHRLLAQVRMPIDWVRFGSLLFYWDTPKRGERKRRALARQYFRQLARQNATSTKQE